MNNFPTSKQQRGAALVVSLVILAVVTVMGVAGLQSTQMEMKMAASARDRSEAFAAVETALSLIEAELVDNPPHLSQFFTGCTNPADGEELVSGSCYTKNCTNGRCFDGVVTQLSAECQVSKDKDEGGEGTDFWKEEDVWTTNSRHDKLYVGASGATESQANGAIEVKYIIEFMCYTGIDDTPNNIDASGYASDETNSGRDMQLFRVTAKAEGLAKRSEVALQSMVRVVDDFSKFKAGNPSDNAQPDGDAPSPDGQANADSGDDSNSTFATALASIFK